MKRFLIATTASVGLLVAAAPFAVAQPGTEECTRAINAEAAVQADLDAALFALSVAPGIIDPTSDLQDVLDDLSSRDPVDLTEDDLVSISEIESVLLLRADLVAAAEVSEGACAEPVEETTTPAPPPATTTSPTITDEFDCEDFSSQAEAQAVLDADPSDPNRLDADGDGAACNSVEDTDFTSSPSLPDSRSDSDVDDSVRVIPSDAPETGDGSTEALLPLRLALVAGMLNVAALLYLGGGTWSARRL